MPPPVQIVVVGAGLAGTRTVEALRAAGHAGPITLVGAEPHPPYDRPPLSKELLAGHVTDSTLQVAWDSLGVDVQLDTRATALGDGVVETDVADYPFDALVIATGAAPVQLPGAQSALVLRTLDDSLALRDRLTPGSRLVVVGAGWIGAEVATTARANDVEVTVVEAADAPLAGALPGEVAQVMRSWYDEAGVELRLASPVTAVEPDRVVLASGESVRADTVLVAVGVRPSVGWLDGSAVQHDRAVVADEHLRTSDPRVYAVGDVVSWPSRRFGVRMNIGHWDNALNAPDVVAANLTGGEEVYDPVPYFWSMQFGRRVQMVGHHPVADRMLWRGSPEDPSWGAYWLRGDALVAALTVNKPRDTIQARKLIEAGEPVAVDRLRDPDVAVRDAAG